MRAMFRLTIGTFDTADILVKTGKLKNQQTWLDKRKPTAGTGGIL